MKCAEIGSEFWEVPVSDKPNNVFPTSTKWFISGRSALKAIIIDSGIHSVSLPDWCCESIILPFIDNGISVSFYDAFSIPDSIETEAVLVMDYFGYSSKKSFCGFRGTVIRDLTHSLFTETNDDADYYFGSLRKWAGFFTGGFAWGFRQEVNYENDSDSYVELRARAMSLKKKYISGLTSNKDYLDVFTNAEKMLDSFGVVPGCDRDIILASFLDIDFIKSRRRKNAQVLIDSLAEVALFPCLVESDCPLFVPVRIKKRDETRNRLIQNGIYCPIHWPISEFQKIGENTSRLMGSELSLVCDQRYNENDMKRIADIIADSEWR